MTFISSSAYTISIPEPILPGELEQLAQVRLPGNKHLCVYWIRNTRQAVCNYENEWYIQSDQNILTGIARVIKYDKNIDRLHVDNLIISEIAGRGYHASEDMVHDFRDCEWSDYACDRIAFQCTLRESETSYTILPPVLSSSTCMCDDGCNNIVCQ
jgi:hypothetical protein